MKVFLHHGMNRRISGAEIFAKIESKSIFIDVMADTTRNLKARILAYFIPYFIKSPGYWR